MYKSEIVEGGNDDASTAGVKEDIGAVDDVPEDHMSHKINCLFFYPFFIFEGDKKEKGQYILVCIMIKTL